VHEASGPVTALAFNFKERKLAYCSVEGGWLHELSASGENRTFRSGVAYTSVLRYDCDSRLVGAASAEQSMVRISDDRGSSESLSESYEHERYERLGGLAIHSSGMIYFSDARAGKPSRLYLMNGENKSVMLASEAVQGPGALCYSSDEKYLFIAQSDNHRIMRMTILPSGKLEYRCMFAELDEQYRAPPRDLAMDAAGNFYCATGKGVHVFDHGGKCLGVVSAGEHCTAVCFAGPALDTLLMAEEGRIWSIRVGVAGMRPVV
jgi:gluconolactonase